MADKLRGGAEQHVRVAASEIVLRDHLPTILQHTRQLFPKLKVTLREGYHPEVIRWLEQQQIDMHIGLLGASKPPPTIKVVPMLKLPLVLMVPRAHKLKSAEELWRQDRIRETLITVPSNEPICRAFQEGLTRRKVDWFSGIEVSTVDLVQTYVVNGYGIGVTVAVPKAKYHPQVRLVPLEDFPQPSFGVLWQGRQTPVLETLLKFVRQAADELVKDSEASAHSIAVPRAS